MLITRETILSILKSNKPKLAALGVTEIGLFGSYVKNKETKTSDIDLLVDFNPKKKILIITWPCMISWKKYLRIKK